MSKFENLLALFPGQGSQVVGMGKSFFDNFEIAKKMFAQADEALGYSLSKLCFEGPETDLTLTQNTQPAILTVSSIAFQLLNEKLNGELKPVAAAGHSLGEYSALVAAGALDFQEAVLLVHKRGKYMQEAVPAGTGKMLAVLKKEPDEIQAAINKVEDGIVQIANINSPGQIVVAGEKNAVDKFATELGNAKIIELPVSAPFHCSLMKPAEEKLAVDLDATTFKDCNFPVYANYTAEPVLKGLDARELLKKQVCGTVRWVESMQAVASQKNISNAIEFGAGKVLVGLLKRIEKDITGFSVSNDLELSSLLS
ncbi:MAG: ACP S-malonyltransferase [Bdellovibrionales bacterium]|nr:ACP S-malonyltransferase [Bdellovibrionales bacterium]